MTAARKIRVRRPQHPILRGLEVIMALLALANFGLVLFDVSYLRLRDLYLRYLPQVAEHYDPVKGIEPHYDTQGYLDKVAELEQAIAQSGLESPSAQALLADLRDRSEAMIVEDPFEIANKSGTLERIKNRMRDRIGNESATQSFKTFWSQDYLQQKGWSQEQLFFNDEIQPLIASNYFRPIDESGQPVDRFWRIDIWFVILFAVDLALRIITIRVRRRCSWDEALFVRWYDVLLLLPFWRLLRVIPVTLRLHQARLLSLDTIQALINRTVAENIVSEVTELVLIRSVSIAQSSIRQGAIRNWLRPQEIVDTNDIDELSVISQRLLESIAGVLPTLAPDLEDLLNHFVKQALVQASIYQNLKLLPGVEEISNELSRQISHQLTQTLATTIREGLKDERGQLLTQQLGEHFLTNLNSELQQRHTLDEVEPLLATWLEELKLTFLSRLETQDEAETLEAAAELRRLRQSDIPEIT